jgi:hypothetical protein
MPSLHPWVLGCMLAAAGVATQAHGPAPHGPAPAAAPMLQLGDGKFSAGPKRDHVVACDTHFPGGGGAHRKGEWIGKGLWTRQGKPIVEGDVAWPNAQISVTREGDLRVVRANSLPKHATGEFPVRAGSRAYAYDRNPNRIREQAVLLRLPAAPTPSATPACVPMGMIGFALSGVAIFNAFDLQGRDAPAYEIQDKCSGHPEIGGRYHYHDWSGCMDDPAGQAGRHSSLAGYMLDGFPIYGPRGEGGRQLRNRDLDACHGHRHAIEIDGRKQQGYHYHFTAEFPYTIGCFRGTPVAAPRMPRPPRMPPPPAG